MKTYCLDTSVFLDNPKVIKLLGASNIIIPFCVITELDSKRKAPGQLGKNARDSIRFLDSLMDGGNLLEGVKTSNGACITVVESPLKTDINDLKIIDSALLYKDANNANVTVLSNDIGLRVHASGLGLDASSYIRSNDNDVYAGYRTVNVNKEIIDLFYKNKILNINDVITQDDNFYPNEMIILKNHSQSAIGRVIKDNIILVQQKRVWDVNSANFEQSSAIELLTDPTVELVTLSGVAGTGKSFLATAAGLDQVIEKELYEKIIILRPIVSVGKDIGFLPGTLSDKMEPWIQPIKDNMTTLLGSKKNVDMYFENGTVIAEAMPYIRGRSIPNSFIIVDECQNMTQDEIKTILTRAAHGSKVVLTGDIEQIDNHKIDIFNNGLTSVIENFKETSIAGHITLTKSQRSKLAALAAKIL